MEPRLTKVIGDWICGEAGDLKFWIKAYQEPSEFGIEGGRISKLEIRKNGEILAAYERGWEKAPAEEAFFLYESILDAFN